MPKCDKCGEDIVFRYVNGRPTPIHLNGGWCSADTNPNKKNTAFKEISSYINPNAQCPVCGKSVFFYQSPDGGRVFFDDLGWPWPKHPCTDRKAPSIPRTKTVRRSGIVRALKNKDGAPLKLYALDQIVPTEVQVKLRFRDPATGSFFWSKFKRKQLNRRKFDLEDIKSAPSFITTKESPLDGFREMQFICINTGKIEKFKVRLIKSSS